MPLNWYPIVLSLLQMAFYFSLSFPNEAMYYFFDNFLQFIELQHICLLYVKEFAAVYNLRPLLLHNLHAFLCWLLPPSTLDQFSFGANDSIDWNSISMNIKKSDTVGSSLELVIDFIYLLRMFLYSFLINNWISIASQEDVVIPWWYEVHTWWLYRPKSFYYVMLFFGYKNVWTSRIGCLSTISGKKS